MSFITERENKISIRFSEDNREPVLPIRRASGCCYFWFKWVRTIFLSQFLTKWRTGDLNSLFLPWEGSVLAARRVRHICYSYHTQPAGDNSLHCPSLVSASTLSWWGIKHLYKCDNNCSLSRIWFLKNSNRICIVPSRMHPTIVEWGIRSYYLKAD